MTPVIAQLTGWHAARKPKDIGMKFWEANSVESFIFRRKFQNSERGIAQATQLAACFDSSSGLFMMKYPACGKVLEAWENRCMRCAVSAAIPDSCDILIARQSLAYRLVRSATIAAGGMLAGAVALVVAFAILTLLPLVFNGALLPVVQSIVVLGGIFGALIGFSAIPVSLGEVQRNATFEVSRAAVRFNDLHDPSGAEAKFIEREIDLAAVRDVRVQQGWLAGLFGYGAIEIFTDSGRDPAAVLRGVSRPHAFKENFELILALRDRR
jgi:hypothetical protein